MKSSDAVQKLLQTDRPVQISIQVERHQEFLNKMNERGVVEKKTYRLAILGEPVKNPDTPTFLVNY